MKKKLLFTAYNMDLGGIEKALINLLKRLDYNKYDVTLILEKKEGMFLSMIPESVKVLEYKVNNSSNVLLRKIRNRTKLIWWKFKLNNHYDFSCSFATYSIPGSHLARAASENNYLWMHGNYYVNYGCNDEALAEFLDSVFTRKFNHIVFVSQENKDDVCKHYKKIKNKSIVCNNYIDGDDILSKAQEPCDIRVSSVPTFINVGRHEEYQKRLSRIIEASEKLVKDGYKFRVLFVGDGPDSLAYDEMIKQKKLDKVIYNLGRKQNPYPYYKKSDAVILSSEYEGFPVVFLESMILEKTILSTKVSDYEELDKKFGMFCDFNTQSVYKMMKKYLDKGFTIKNKFNYEEYNKDIYNKIEKLINK